MTENETRGWNKEELRLLKSYAHLCLSKALFSFSVGVAALIAVHFVVGGLTLPAMVPALGVLMLLTGGFANGNPGAFTAKAGIIICLQVTSLIYEAIGPMSSSGPKGIENVITAMEPVIQHAPVLFGMVGCLLGAYHVVAALKHHRYLASLVAGVGDRSIEA